MDLLAFGTSWAMNKAPSPHQILRSIGLASTLPWSDLRGKLSPQASIVLADQPGFLDLVSRWRDWHAPNVGAVVNVFTEYDVQETIRYANEHNVPFLARSGGHGATEALSLAKDAIMIDVRGMNSIQVAEDGESATIAGGALVKQVVDGLWAAGKQTVTGICECVGFSAPALGGGHGWLQGEHGLAADQVISARVVLPNGDAVTASEGENADLFWALRGAGHNFGIVTEWRYHVYDIKNPKWSYEIMIFSGDKLEELIDLTKEMMKTQPPEVTHWIFIVNMPEFDAEKPIIWYAIFYDGPEDAAHEYAKPVAKVGPLNADTGAVPMPGLAAKSFMDEGGVSCAKGSTGLRFPIGLKTYNTAAVRKVYDDIAETSIKIPELAGTFFLLEGYSTQGIQAIDEASTAFPHRADNILVTPYILYDPNPALDEVAQEFGERMRQYLLEGSDDPQHLRAYVNYAHGKESPEAVYGWEDWRLQKLRELKAKWDPENRMKYYVPIV